MCDKYTFLNGLFLQQTTSQQMSILKNGNRIYAQ